MDRNVIGATPKSVPAKAGDLPAATTGTQGNAVPKEEPDSYITRVLKYIPGEVVAFFIFVNSLLAEATKQPMAKLEPGADSTLIQNALGTATMANGSVSVMTISVLSLILGAVMVWPCLYAQRNPEKSNEYFGLTATVSTVGFFVWAYALDAVAFRPWHDGVLASVLLASFTLISGAISPAAQDAMASYFPKWRKKDATLPAEE